MCDYVRTSPSYSEQWRIIYSVIFDKRDNCAVMATGTLIMWYTCMYMNQIHFTPMV